jgi:hypothetical protein
MKIAKNKAKATVIALFLVLTIAATLIPFLPTAYAAVNFYNTFVYVGATPNIIGVNQQVLLVMWTDNIPPDIGETAAGGRAGWSNVGINITKPDGTTETFIIEKTDPVGGGWILYMPNTVGTYYIQSFFPEVWKNSTTTQSHYSAAVSEKVSFTVQQEPIQAWPEAPLPSGYWTRPINDASRNWYVLGGNWLGGAYQQPAGAAGGTTSNFVYGLGPESAHILWSKPYYAGGIMDERFGVTGYETGHYQGINFGLNIIFQGKIWYSVRADAHSSEGYLVVDLYTGETLYFANESSIPSFGQIYNYESPNQHGGLPYLWRTSGVRVPSVNSTGGGVSAGTVWQMLDGYTEKSICYVANVTSGGTAVYGKDGSILRYNIANLGTTANPNYYLQLWNVSAIPSMLAGIPPATAGWQWRPSGGGFGGGPALRSDYFVHDGNKGFSLNKSIPSVLGPRNALLNETGTIRAVREDEYVIIGTGGRNDERGVVQGYMMAVSLKRGEEGRKLWDMTFTPPAGSQAANVTISLTGVYPEDGVILFENSKRLKRWGYSLETGQQLWEGEPEVQNNYYGMTENVYEGKLFSYGYGGQVRAYNITTGDILWTYNATTVGFEIGYGGNYPTGIACIADGKLYTVSSEHSATQPMWRGPNLRCINASNGEEIWKILFWGGRMSPTEPNVFMADGIIVGLNYYDMEVYAFGKGNSATTVTASPKVSVHGDSVLIEGTVTDDTPNSGRRNTNGILDFTLKGTPAISDEDMGRWMEYLFMNQGIPADAKGVEVSLDAVDPNGNFVHIGTATSDITGAYGYAFTPEVPGTYQIIATFAGSKSYGASFAQTYITVDEAPPATLPPEYPQPIDNTLTIVGTGIAIIIAVAIVGILLFRKRP